MVVTGRQAGALQWLGKAMEHGYTDMRITDNPDLASLHGTPEFEAIVAEVRRRSEESETTK